MGSYKLFDIIGPRMIGPSSSHTAGAARLGNVASRILGNQVRTAEITLYGSFAQTGKGHGTDKAIIAGLLGFAPDDLRIRNAYQEARKRGMEVQMVLSTQEMPPSQHCPHSCRGSQRFTHRHGGRFTGWCGDRGAAAQWDGCGVPL